MFWPLGIALIAGILAFWYIRIRHPPAPKIDYAAMEIDVLREIVSDLTDALNATEQIAQTMRDIRYSGGNSARLRQIVNGVWKEVFGTDQAPEWLFDGENDGEEWQTLLAGKLASSLPRILDFTEEIVLWHGQNKYKTTLEPAGKGVSRLVVTRRKFCRYCGECAWCADEIRQERADETCYGTPVFGITYGDQDYVFDTVSCRLNWLFSADGGRDFRGEITAWNEWEEGGNFDGKELSVVRESYKYYR